MASVGFRWLDVLEKEFDKAFVDLDLTIGELESEEPDVVFNVRQKLCTLSSCFAQLTHKSQTIFQNSAKIEAELIHMRAELVESKAKRELLEQELHNLLLQLHSSQLSQLPDTVGWHKDSHRRPDITNIKKKLEAELRSPVHKNRKDQQTSSGQRRQDDELKFSPALLEVAQLKAENVELHEENSNLRQGMLTLNSEVYGAKLAAKYLDKELAGRIQQLQLLGREMRGDVRDKLWRQLESEILLQRHKTVVRACRRNSMLNNAEKHCCKPEREPLTEPTQHFGDIRTVVVKRKAGQGLGISITGGREHGVPILISELEPNGPAAMSQQLYIGDAILFVSDRDLRQACHREAVEILQQQTGDCTFQVQYIAADDSDNSLEEDGYNFRFFDEEVAGTCNSRRLNPPSSVDLLNTPTAPRTPESSTASRPLSRNTPELKAQNKIIITTETPTSESEAYNNYNINRSNGNIETNENEANNIDNLTATADTVNCNNPLTVVPSTECIDIKALCQTDYDLNTTDLVLVDNVSNNIIKLENFKKVDILNSNDNNLTCSLNSLNSENLSSPMQTSADVFLDSELLSTDIASNDSQSPKNIQTTTKAFTFRDEVKDYTQNFTKPLTTYESNDSLSQPKSDQSLLNSDESCDSSPVHKVNRDYKKVQRKHKKKYFGVKTLQSIFNKHDGYSDISSTASEMVDEIAELKKKGRHDQNTQKLQDPEAAVYKCKAVYPDTSPQFEENIHNILSDIFIKSFAPNPEQSIASLSLNKATGNKKYFSLHGQHLRVGKALRLCPNEDYSEQMDQEQRKEKLLARYFEYVSINTDKKKFSRLQKWQPTSPKEMYLFIATTLLISRNKKLKLNDCWSRDPLLHTPIFGKTMSRDRYLLLLRLLHFCDNTKQVPGDRLYKLDSILNFLKSKFQRSFMPFRNLCIDESLVLYKGRLSFKQYIKTKRHRFGIKFFVLADVETDYILNFIIYTGSSTKITEHADLGISGSIVATLIEPYLNKGHHLYTDNWYTSPKLAQYLHQHKTNFCGTVRSNRIGMPVLAELKQKGATASQHTEMMMVTKWLDRRLVHMLTTIHENQMVSTEKRDRSTGEHLKKPKCIMDYNENMGSIDKIDMLLSSVECLRKSTKWYKKIFFHLLDLTIINAHAIYKVKTGKFISLADFQLELIRQLIEKYAGEEKTAAKLRAGRPSTKDLPTRLGAHHFPKFVPPVPGGKRSAQRICFVCKHTQLGPRKRRDSRYQCTECEVGLCIVPCFEKYHTLKKF